MMINKSFQTFRNACDTSTETFGKLESLYNLALKSEQKTLSESQRNDFEIVFSQKIIAFYETIPDVALTFVASFITGLFKRRFSVHAKKKNNGCYMSSLQLEPWEHVLRVIVIGLETYSASHPQKHSQLGEILYKPLFGILSSTAGLQFSIRLKIEIFGFLSDLAETSPENRELLKERDVLGGPRLGVLISSTNEYLVLVILLQLLESMISDNEDEDAVMDIGKDVFQNIKIKRSLKQASPELIKILQEAGNTAWDLTADRLIRAMAATDAQKPKPFLLASSRIRANDRTFSHPKTLRHIYMDNGAFIVNIEDELEGGIDCLDIAFKSMVSMSFKEIPVSSKAEISLGLSSPPMMATEAVPSKTNSYAVVFEINLADLEEFKDALKCRGVDKLARRVASRLRAKHSVASQPLNLNNISCISLEEKSLAVEQFYHTSTPEPMASHKEAVCEVKFSETDMTAFTSNNKSISSPPNYSSDEEGSRPLNFVHEVQTSVGKLLVNNNGNYKEPKTLQNPDKLDDPHKSMLKRKRDTAEVGGCGPKSESNEGHHYNSQFLTKTVLISTKKYKARRRVLSSVESSSSEDDIIPLASPVRITGSKHLIKLNTDRPDRLILPMTSKTERDSDAMKAVPSGPSILSKPRPKPRPKRRKVIEASNSDEFEEPPALLKKTSNEEMTVTMPISSENDSYTAVENGMNDCKSPTSQTTIVEKPAASLPIVVEASSPFKGKGSELEFLNEEEPAQDVDMDISEKLNAFNDSDRDDDMDKSILSLRAERDAQDSVNVSLTLVHELPRAQTKVSHTKTKVIPPLKSALKGVSRSESSIIDLTHLADSPKKNIAKLLECDPGAQTQLKSYPADNIVDNKDMGLTDISNTSRITAQLPTVTFKEYPEEIKDCSIDVFSRYFISKLETNKDSHPTRLLTTPPFKNVSRRICEEASRRAPKTIDNRTPYSKASKFVSEDVESSSSQEILTPEQRVVNVLNKIHETIVENLGKKIKGTSASGNATSRKFRLYAAEELEKMLQESIKHRQNMVVLEHKYGAYHKSLKGGLEEIRKSNREIKKTLEQVVQDHDTLSLVRKMPARLAPRPKIL